MTDRSRAVLEGVWSALGGPPDAPTQVRFAGDGDLPSVFAVTDMVAASVGAACLAVAEFVAVRHGTRPAVTVDRRLAALWCGESVQPEGWSLPPTWDAVAGDYEGKDGWIRLHTNAPHHREAALAVLGVPADRTLVAKAVRGWAVDDLETEIVGNDGCAAAMRSMAGWAGHPQGEAVGAEPLLQWEAGDPGRDVGWTVPANRPLAGVRVLDMTRVLAGPVATRFLAGFGSEVLRIDPPDWDEPAVLPGVTLGKRRARLDLRRPGDRATWEELLRSADVLVHGYRPGALPGLDFDAARRRDLRPGLVDVSLDAYGWSGPWAGRRGFDSLVQMSSGVAEAGMRLAGRDRPTPLPVQALDHATGYLLAAAAIRGLTTRVATGMGTVVRGSLARTAALLTGLGTAAPGAMAPAGDADWSPGIEATDWGPAQRLRPPAAIEGAAMRWDLPAGRLGTAPAVWL